MLWHKGLRLTRMGSRVSPLPARQKRLSMLELTEITLAVPQLPMELDGLRILHVSDLHIRGYRRHERRLVDVARQGCDLFVCTGDVCTEIVIPSPLRFLHNNKQKKWRSRSGMRLSMQGLTFPPRIDMTTDVCRRILAELSCLTPPFFVQGNHDPDLFMKQLPQLGVRVLDNETVQLELPDRGRLNICGLSAPQREFADVPKAVTTLQPELFTLALCHYPEMAEALAATGAELILTGHTHGGQVCLPNARPLMTHSRTGAEYSRGLTRIGGSWLYTNRGLGTSMIPLRLFSRPEITRITLQQGKREDTVIRATPL